MPTPPQVPPVRVAVRDASDLSWDSLAKLLELGPFRAFLDVVPDGVILIDPSGRVAACNPVAERALGLKRADVLGLPIEHVAQRCAIDLGEFLLAGERGQSTGTLQNRKDGRLYIGSRRTVRRSEYDQPCLLLALRDSALWTSARRGGQAESAPNRADLDNLLLSPEIAAQVDQAIRAVRRRARLLILGESGTGKTAIAYRIHKATGAGAAPFVHVNCGSIPETLFESEMFGYERGAFTGALQSGKRGYIESAASGTLFLDEVGEIPLASQAKLLNFLDDGRIQPVGAVASKHVQAQVITATNRDLRAMVAEGKFRPDLYYRLKTFTIRIPPLRERTDRDALIETFVARLNAVREQLLTVSPQCLRALRQYPFPGNIRELSNILEHLSIVAEAEARVEHLPPDMEWDAAQSESFVAKGNAQMPPDAAPTLKEQVRAYEDRIIRQAIARFGSKREAARQLGVDIATLVRKTRRGDDPEAHHEHED